MDSPTRTAPETLPIVPRFYSGATADAADAALREAVAAWTHAEHGVVLWFAEITRRRLFTPLGYGSMYLYATEALGFSDAKTYQLLRVAAALEQHDVLRRALASGRLTWTKAREIVDVITKETARDWVERACTRSRRALRGEVQRAKARARDEREGPRGGARADERARAWAGACAGERADARAGARADAGHRRTLLDGHRQATLAGTEPAEPPRPTRVIEDDRRSSVNRAWCPRGDALSLPSSGSESPRGTIDRSTNTAVPPGDEPPGGPLPRTVTLRCEPEQHAAFEGLLTELHKAGARGSRVELVLEGLEAALGMRLRDRAVARGAAPRAANAPALTPTHAPASMAARSARAARGAKKPRARTAVAATGCPSRTKRGPSGRHADTSGDIPVFVAMRSPYQVFVRVCPGCEEAMLATSGRETALDHASLTAILEDCDIVDPEHRCRATIPPRVRRAVYARDGFCCQAPGCARRQHLTTHHALPRAAGGRHTLENGVTLCWPCHRALHAQSERGRELRRWRRLRADATSGQSGDRPSTPAGDEVATPCVDRAAATPIDNRVTTPIGNRVTTPSGGEWDSRRRPRKTGAPGDGSGLLRDGDVGRYLGGIRSGGIVIASSSSVPGYSR